MMEPVPETERMEEFRASPVPRLRLFEDAQYDNQNSEREPLKPFKPLTVRRSTDPSPTLPSSGWTSPPLALRPRNTSPYHGGHGRSKSSASNSAPLMSRTQSMPGVNAAGQLFIPPPRPSSPRGSPNRSRALRKHVDEIFPTLPRRSRSDAGESPVAIPEEEDDDMKEGDTHRTSGRSSSPSLGSVSGSYTRRTSSPLRHVPLQYSASGAITPTTPSSMASSPLFQSIKFSDSFPDTSLYSRPTTSSSVPTTPSSIRSRSPSISSLETIPDSPDAEEAALEAERMARLRAAADAADGDEAALEAKRQSSLDMAVRGRTLGLTYGSRDKRKRWSVCGAERRGDLDLETIWED